MLAKISHAEEKGAPLGSAKLLGTMPWTCNTPLARPGQPGSRRWRTVSPSGSSGDRKVDLDRDLHIELSHGGKQGGTHRWRHIF